MKKILALAALALVIIAAAVSGIGNDAIPRFAAWLRGLGHGGGFAFVLVYALAAVLLVPGAALTILAGSVYGLIWGSVYVSIASVLGAALPFWLTRHIAREFVVKQCRQDPRIRAIDDAVDREGWRIVALTRLSPLLPYNLLNYALGLSRISFGQYLLWSWLGMLPGTVLYVYLGAAAGRLAGTTQASTASPLETTAFWLGIIATAALTLYVSQLTRRALKRATENFENEAG